MERKALWKDLKIRGVGEKFLGVVKAFYENRKERVRINGEESENSGTDVVVRQNCVMSPGLCIWRVN